MDIRSLPHLRYFSWQSYVSKILLLYFSFRLSLKKKEEYTRFFNFVTLCQIVHLAKKISVVRDYFFSFLSRETLFDSLVKAVWLSWPRRRPFRDPSFVVSTPYYPLSVFLVISFYFLMAPCSWRGSPVLMNTADDVEIVGPCCKIRG